MPDAAGSDGRAVSLCPIRSEPHEHPETDPLGTRLWLGHPRRRGSAIIPRDPLKMS